MKIATTRARGIVPILDPQRLPDENATIAHNVDLEGAIIAPLIGPGFVKTLANASRKRVYPYNGGWLEWDEDVDVVKSPVDDDIYDRIFYTGSGVPKVRGILSGAEVEYDLGIPKPTLNITAVAQAKGTVTWTRTWFYQFENSAGTVTQSGSLTEGAYSGTNVHELNPGKVYRMQNKPARTTAAASDRFVMYFDGYEGTEYLGRLYPTSSANYLSSDFELAGADAKATQDNSGAPPEAVFTIRYNTSRASDYEVDRYYVYTLVSVFFEEGPPSDPSNRVPVDPTEDAVLTNFDLTVPGNHNITTIRIYRTVTGVSGTFYFYVGEFAIGTATYTDTQEDSDITGNGILVSQHFVAPPAGLIGIVEMPGGYLAGFVGNTLYLSEANRPHAWPPEYAQTRANIIVAIARAGDGLLVLTEGPPSLGVGDTPGAFLLQGINSTQACVSKRGVATYGDEGRQAVFYPSPQGLVSYESGATRVVTAGYYSGNDGGYAPWSDLEPENMIGVVHNGRYIGKTPTGTIIYRLQESIAFLTTSDITFQGFHYSMEDDQLYIIVGNKLKQWGAGEALTYTWSGKLWVFNKPGRFNTARVTANEYPPDGDAVPLTFNLYANGVLVHTKAVTSIEEFRLPELRKERQWLFSIVGNKKVTEILISTSARDV